MIGVGMISKQLELSDVTPVILPTAMSDLSRPGAALRNKQTSKGTEYERNQASDYNRTSGHHCL